MVRSNRHQNLDLAKREQQQIYNHLIFCVKIETPAEVLERFKNLFIRGTGYRDNRIWSALQVIVEGENADLESFPFFNRCCHIIINRWQMQPNTRYEIVELVILIERALPPGGACSPNARRLRDLIRDFQKSDYFLCI